MNHEPFGTGLFKINPGRGKKVAIPGREFCTDDFEHFYRFVCRETMIGGTNCSIPPEHLQ
jgi:hypothetical protein